MVNRVYKATLQTLSGGREQIQKGDEVAPIKSGTFHYAATAGSPGQYGKGGAFSSYIEFEYYASGGVTLSRGDMLLYAQEWDTDTSFADIDPSREQGINVFYVTEIKEKRGTIYILAYDMVEALLDVDFSETLKANEANFPMTIEALYGLVRTLTGVYAPWASVTLLPAERDNYWKQATINYFYSPGITARDVLNWIGEIAGQTILALYSGEMGTAEISHKTKYKTFAANENDYWQNADKYAVCPGDGAYTVNGSTAINAWYKENGLEIGKAFPTYDGVDIIASDGTTLGYYYSTIPPTNVLRISGNMIAENINTFANIYSSGADTGVTGTYNDLAEDILTHANIVSGMTAAKAQLFPFRCPYTIGSRMYCFDTDGNQYIVPIMSIDLTEDGVIIGAYGGEVGETTDYGNNGNDTYQTSALRAKINQLDALITDTNPIKTDTITATTNSGGNISTGLDIDSIILAAIRTDGTSVCTPIWSTNSNAWFIHVATNAGAAVTSTSVTVKIIYIEPGTPGVQYYLVDANGNYLTDSNGNKLTVTA